MADKTNNNTLDITNKNTPEGKGFRTFYQTLIATVVAFLAGLWNVPGVPEFVTQFARTEGVQFLLFLATFIGIPAGLIAWYQNRKGK
jgi:hypothetical protein